MATAPTAIGTQIGLICSHYGVKNCNVERTPRYISCLHAILTRDYVFDQPRSFVSHVRSHICSLKYVKSRRGIREKKLYEFLQAIFTDAILVQLLL